MRIEYQAHAKVNLTLHITGRRPDGYHTLESVMQTVTLADRLVFTRADAGLTLACDDPSLPTGPDNLVVRAAQALRHHVGRPELAAHIALEKRIPAGAGLGGGSSDAAATLLGLGELWGLGLEPADLVPVAAGLGSDVPYFLYGGIAVVRGAGEQVEPVPMVPPWLHLVIARPDFPISTAQVYRRYDELGLPEQDQLATAPLLAALEQGHPESIAAALHNDLEQAVLPFAPEVAKVREALLSAGCLAALLCGSGSAVFGLCRDEDHAQQVERDTAHLPWRVRVLSWP